MKKIVSYAVLLALLVLVWVWYAKTGEDTKAMEKLLEQLIDSGAPDGQVSKLKSDMHGMEGQQTFTGILLAFLSAGLVGIVFVFDILPLLAHKVTHAIYDSAEMVERDVMHDARSLLAQGEYESAVEAFRDAAKADPMNRFPWMEIARIQKDNLHDPGAAIQTLREALEGQEWEINDAAYFLFRIAELYDETQEDRVSATAILEQVIELFPETRHSANARHKLREWEQQAAAAAATGDEPA
jgi:tetratricopeptide (TPR) repeat protein